MKLRKTLITASIALGAASVSQAQIVNIDWSHGFTFDGGGSDPAPVAGQHLNLIGTPVTLTLGPGDYVITNAWGLPGALFSAWSYQLDANRWAWAFVAADDATRKTLFYAAAGGGNSAAAVAALPAVQNFSYDLSLLTTTTLAFTLRDYYVLDNGGGISLKITPVGAVPEPFTGAMMAAGLGVLSFSARRPRRR